MEDINILGEYENIELTTLLRTLKKEGIENFVVVRKNKLENLIKAYKELEEENQQLEAIKDEAIRRYNLESIPVSLVEEEIEKLDKQLEEDLQDERKVNSNRFIIICQCKNCLQELLEKRK